MACTYIFYDKKTGETFTNLTYLELVLKFLNNYKDFSDIIFDRDLDSVFSEVLAKKKVYKAINSKDIMIEEPGYAPDDTFTVPSFVNSASFRVRGLRILPQTSTEDYIKNMADLIQSLDNISEERAREIAEDNIKHWEVINEHAKEFHQLINSFSFQTLDRYDFIKHCRGTIFEPFALDIYDQIYGEGNRVFRYMRGSQNVSNGKTKVVLNVNLLAKINDIGKDIVGHYDNLVIGTDGTLHLYNYKITTNPVAELQSNSVKARNYKFLLALLKQILAYNGFNVKGVSLHLIPVRVTYNDDYSQVQSINIYDPITYPQDKDFEVFNRAARYFIKSNVNVDPINLLTIDRINHNLKTFLPERAINLQGILKSVESWINQEYTSKWLGRIKKVNAPDHVYELFFDDEYKNPIKITSSEEPINNEEIKEHVRKHLNQISNDTNEFLNGVVRDIKSSRNKGYSILGRGRFSNRNTQAALSFVGSLLNLYFRYTTDSLGTKSFDWDLISNDTLLDANILVFKKNDGTDLIDVIVLTNYNLGSSIKMNGQSNIMGHYTLDTSTDTKGLINYKATFANIEALRAMIILNEALPLIIDSNLLLGSLKIISTSNSGMETSMNIELLNKELFLPSIGIVKKNVHGFEYTNNFIKAKYVDPIDILISDYDGIMLSELISDPEKEEISNLGFTNLESLKTRESKRVALRALINNIYKIDPSIETMNTNLLLLSLYNDGNPLRRALINLYVAGLRAYLYYSGINVRNELRISSFEENFMRLNRINNYTYLLVIRLYYEAIDTIASRTKEEFNHVGDFIREFYESKGYGFTQASILGNQVKAFDNLYERNDSNKIMMRFRNPYKADSFKPMTNEEKVFLKKALFEFAKVRSKIYGYDFNFKESEIDSPKLKTFIELHESWYFNPPLEKASNATANVSGERVNTWKRNVTQFFKNPVKYFNEVSNGVSEEEYDSLKESFESLTVRNPYIMGDGYGDGLSRTDIINKYPEGYFETNVENLLAHYIEKLILVEEYQKTIVAMKGILLQLQLLGNAAGEGNKAGIDLTTKMVTDFVKLNMFNLSLMEPETENVVAWLVPFRKLVSYAYIAGNILSMFRDVFNGIWENSVRTITKYQTDIDAKSLTRAYKEVTIASFSSVKGINIINLLCKTYRLSNMDISRISEGLTTSNAGIANLDRLLYKTLRAPDFLNRMVLFVAKCMKDGSWEAFDIVDHRLVYDWRKDKRYSIYADSSKKGTKEYEELRVAYMNAIRLYNLEHPENTLSMTDDLPVAYSNELIYQMRQVADSIYGAYDRSMKAKYEFGALGITFAMFSTWMNGITANYFTKPGTYIGGPTELTLDTDGSGNLLFMDGNGMQCVLIVENGQTKYYYLDSGEEVTNLVGLAPIMVEVPIVILGIIYTLGDAVQILRKGGLTALRRDFWNNPMLRKNIYKLFSDIVILALFTALFKLAIKPLYTEYKEKADDEAFVLNALVDLFYKAGDSSFESFKGILAPLAFIGEDTNPPIWKLGTSLLKLSGLVLFGDKTMLDFVTSNVPLFKFANDAINAATKE